MVHYTHRGIRRFGRISRRFRDACQCADGCASVGGYVYGAPALRVQFDQTQGRDFRRRTVRAAGYETNLLYLACLAALVLGGSGPLVIDGLIRSRRTAAMISQVR